MKITRRSQAELGLLGNAFIWGTTFVVVQGALSHVSTLLFLCMRFGLAGLILLGFYAGKLKRNALLPGMVAGLFLFLGYLFQTAGLKFTTPSKSAFFTSMSIPMVPLLSSLVYRTRTHLIELLGVSVATAGMMLMTLQGTTLRFGKGDALTFLCAIAFALHIVALGHFSGKFDFQTLAVMQIVTAALLSAGSFWWAEPVQLQSHRSVWLAVGITGLFATALAFSVQAWAQQFTSATRTALIYTLEPVFAWGTSWLLLGERLPWTAVLGAILIIAGVLLVELKPTQAVQHPTG